jgi:hypothetical protein
MDNDAAAAPSANGIAECLRMLADEAAALRLPRTLMALLETAQICSIEAAAIRPVAAPKRGKPGPCDPIFVQ